MYTYRIVSDHTGVPEFADLGAPIVSPPASPGATFDLIFTGVGFQDLHRFEPAVGVRCRVVRTTEDGAGQECGGAVLQVEPRIRVSMDGAGWQ